MFPKIGNGLGLRAAHYQDILLGHSKVDWFEAISEDYIGVSTGNGGRPLQILKKIREHTPIVLHGVSLNIGSTDPLNFSYLKRLKTLIEQIEPIWISDHFCWTGVNDENLHDLLPLPYTEEVINHLVSRIVQCQDYFGRRIIFENVSSYIQFKHSEMTEWEFISEIAKRADCGLLLDVNNIYVNSVNHRYNSSQFIANVPVERVAQIHLAGHSDMGSYLIDTHDAPVCAEVWKLYAETLKRFGNVSTMIEWDAHIPTFDILQKEIFKAKDIQEKCFGNSKQYRYIQENHIAL